MRHDDPFNPDKKQVAMATGMSDGAKKSLSLLLYCWMAFQKMTFSSMGLFMGLKLGATVTLPWEHHTHSLVRPMSKMSHTLRVGMRWEDKGLPWFVGPQRSLPHL